MLYLLEVKSGSIISAETLPEFFDGPIGIANFGKNETLISAKTNIKSRFGIALLSAIKGKEVKIKEEDVKELYLFVVIMLSKNGEDSMMNTIISIINMLKVIFFQNFIRHH